MLVATLDGMNRVQTKWLKKGNFNVADELLTQIQDYGWPLFFEQREIKKQLWCSTYVLTDITRYLH